MLQKLSILTPPESLPVTWAEAKAQCKITLDSEQSYVESLIEAAADYAQEAMACSLMQQTLQIIFETGDDLLLPRGPILSITSVVDADDDDISSYRLVHVGKLSRLVLNQAATFPLTVTYEAGHSVAALIPASIRLAIKQHVASLYAVRESISEKGMLPVPHSLQDFYRLHSRALGVA